jgi:parvulin-like peptidyl-prolyl isomerase
MAQVRQQLAEKYSGDQLEQAVQKAEKEVLDDLIREKLLVQKATELGLNANTDARLSSIIQKTIKEHNLKDTDALEKELAKQGMTLRDLREQWRKQMIVSDLINEFVRSRITLLSEEIEKYYKDHAAEYTIPEEVTLSEIMILNEKDAEGAENRTNDIYNRLKQGEPFAALASQYSKGPTASKGGGIDTYVISKLNPDIAKAIANLKEGEVSKVQKLKDGYIIYRVDARKPASVLPLDQVRDKIRGLIYEKKYNPEYERYVSQLWEDAHIQKYTEIK